MAQKKVCTIPGLGLIDSRWVSVQTPGILCGGIHTSLSGEWAGMIPSFPFQISLPVSFPVGTVEK